MRAVESDALRGWRAWKIVEDADGPALASFWMQTLWPARRALESGCPAHGPHPRAHHTCGIHAFGAQHDALVYADRPCEPLLFVRRVEHALGVAVGVVSGWGRAVRHSRGWRSQFAYPYDLYLPGGDTGLARALADRYAVDVSPFSPA